ncbi:MAG: DUF6491 family protein [Woeseiaceae bacterium]
MRHNVLVVALLLAAACSSTPQTPVDTQTVRDYVEVGELEDVQNIRVYARDSWSRLTNHFVIYEARNDNYLIEFHRRCRELQDNSRIVGDRRYDHNRLRVNEDTLRGCRIGKIYPLTEGQAIELQSLGKGPGEGN